MNLPNIFLLLLATVAVAATVVSAADSFTTGPCLNTPRCQCKWSVGKRLADCSNAGLTSVPTTLSPDIQSLNLDANPLKHLENDVFKTAGLLNLQTLTVARCELEYVDENAFKDLKIMTHLDLSTNNLTRINPKTFDGNEGLKTLRLSNNPITQLVYYQFPPLGSLKSIDLSNCALSLVDRTAFKNLGASVESLMLNNNQLRELREEALVPLTSLKSVALHANPWVCDCRLKNFRDWVVNKRLYSRPTACAEPSRLHGKPWDTVQPSEFACKPSIELPVTRVFAAPGVDATLACKVTGSPVPHTRWVFNGRIVNNNTHPAPFADQTYVLRDDPITADGVERWFNLTITRPSDQDLGSYLCVAENNGGVMEKSVALTFDDPAIYVGAGGFSITEEQLHILVGAIVCIVILLLILAAVCYFCLCRRQRQQRRLRDAKTNGGANGKAHNSNMVYSNGNGCSPDSQKLLPGGGSNGFIVSSAGGKPTMMGDYQGLQQTDLELHDLSCTPSVTSNVRQSQSSSSGSAADGGAGRTLSRASYIGLQGGGDQPHHFPDLLDHRRNSGSSGGGAVYGCNGSLHTLSPANLMLTPQQQAQYAHLISPFQRSGTLPLHHHHHHHTSLAMVTPHAAGGYQISPVPLVQLQQFQQQQQHFQHQRPGYVTLPRRPRTSWSVPRDTPSPGSCSTLGRSSYTAEREPIYDGIGPRTSADGSSRLSLNKSMVTPSPNVMQQQQQRYYAPIQELQECPPTPKIQQPQQQSKKKVPLAMSMLPKSTPNMLDLSDLGSLMTTTCSSEATLLEENISAYCEPFGKAVVPQPSQNGDCDRSHGSSNSNRHSVSSNDNEQCNNKGSVVTDDKNRISTNRVSVPTPARRSVNETSLNGHSHSPPQKQQPPKQPPPVPTKALPKTLPKPKVKPVPPPKPKKSFQQDSSPSPDSSQAPLISFQDEGADGSEV